MSIKIKHSVNIITKIKCFLGLHKYKVDENDMRPFYLGYYLAKNKCELCGKVSKYETLVYKDPYL